MMMNDITEIIRDFAEQEMYLRGVIDYLAATNQEQELESMQRLEATWKRGQDAMLVLAATPPSNATNAMLALVDSLIAIMTVIESMLCFTHNETSKGELPECVA
ncbi:MAG: hypothetical protein DRI77_15180 [Chloroflexi bacterium]|nr:MAG: hypothetical protein DRI77_15180 [Chloroflexota bacterium]